MTSNLVKVEMCEDVDELQTKAKHGMCSGVNMQGKNTLIENCEIFGFPMHGVEVFPVLGDDIGTVKIDRCYIHNCKSWGWGYGVWLGGGSSNMTCDLTTPACNTLKNINNVLKVVPILQENSPFQDEVLELSNTYFYDNGKDFDASGNRNSFIIDHCTFSERVMDFNINHHEDADVCNGFMITDPYICPTAPDANTNPHPNECEACNFTLKDVGGNRMWIWNSFFYKGGGEIYLTYPNTFDPTFVTNGCYDPYSQGTATPIGFTSTTSPLIHIGRDPLLTPPLNLEKWNYFINSTYTGKLGWITIAKTDVNHWSPADPHIEVKYNVPPYPGSDDDGQNFYVPNANHAPVPVIEFDIRHLNAPNGVNPHLLVTQGDKVAFSTLRCRNSGFRCGDPDMLYIWNFHEMPYDYLDEIRTGALRSSVIKHLFNQVGITNVNLMAIDVNNGFAASNVVTQEITVMPPKSNIRPQPVTMVVNIKDTYDGRHLTGLIPCRTDRVDDCYDFQTNSWLPCNPLDHSPTGFMKFIEINGVVVWSPDIAEDNGGWQRIEMNIENFICTDDDPPPAGGCNPPLDKIEIGLRTVAQGADAAKVRGVSIYIDDVYIQSNNGYNALENGDFEELHSNNAWAKGWDHIDLDGVYRYECGHKVFTGPTGLKGSLLKKYEMRSGHSAYWGALNRWLLLKQLIIQV